MNMELKYFSLPLFFEFDSEWTLSISRNILSDWDEMSVSGDNSYYTLPCTV